MRHISVRALAERVEQGTWRVSCITTSKDLMLKGNWPVTSYLDNDPGIFKSRIPDLNAYLQDGAHVTVAVHQIGGKGSDFVYEVTK